MKKVIFFLMLTLLTVQLSYSQCDNPISDSIQFTNGTEVYVKYCGEIGNRGERSGYGILHYTCLLYTSPSPRDATLSRMPSSA